MYQRGVTKPPVTPLASTAGMLDMRISLDDTRLGVRLEAVA